MYLAMALLAFTVNGAPALSVDAPRATSRNGQLLEALAQADQDFTSVLRGLGLSGSAPLAGVRETEAPAVSTAAKASRKLASKARRSPSTIRASAQSTPR
jgi:hypothetical protein